MALSDVKIVGVVNVTEDSFSDGGRFLDPEDALRHAEELMRNGADYVELGPAASHPEAKTVSTSEQVRRISPVLDSLVGRGARVSVDSPDPKVQCFAARNGASMINDVRGFPDPGVAAECVAAGCDLVVMHSVRPAERASRLDTAPERAVDSAYSFFAARLDSLDRRGLSRDRIILDPGMGYFLGSMPGPSLAMLRELGALRDRFARPLLISVSRKSFVRRLTGRGPSESGPGSLAGELFAISRGVEYVRTHDVKALRDALTVLRAIAADSAGSPPEGPLRQDTGSQTKIGMSRVVRLR